MRREPVELRPTAMVAGATGLVGRHLVEALRRRRAEDGGPAYRSVTLLVRRPTGMATAVELADEPASGPAADEPASSQDGPQVEAFSPESMGELGPGALPPVREVVMRFSRLHQLTGRLKADHVFCALGTTIKKARSRNRFREIDHDYPVSLARMMRETGSSHFSVVSSLGADPRARSFYLKTKGEMERSLERVGFPSLAILRPSVIGGKRGEFRFGEVLGKALLSIVPGRMRTVHAADIAEAMVTVALEGPAGVRVVESDEIRRIAR